MARRIRRFRVPFLFLFPCRRDFGRTNELKDGFRESFVLGVFLWVYYIFRDARYVWGGFMAGWIGEGFCWTVFFSFFWRSKSRNFPYNSFVGMRYVIFFDCEVG